MHAASPAKTVRTGRSDATSANYLLFCANIGARGEFGATGN